MTLHSTDHHRHFDCIVAKPSDLKEMQAVEYKYQHTMRGVKLVAGKEDPFEKYMHSMLKEGSNDDESHDSEESDHSSIRV